MTRLTIWTRSKLGRIKSAYRKGGKNYRKFAEETSNDNWNDSLSKARQELEEALIKVDKRKKLSREIKYKVKNGIELTLEEEKFIGVIRID
jgi:hypothetical protein